MALGNNIADSLKKLGISFETSYQPAECDITSCFERDSREGNLLLDFLLQRAGYRDDGPLELMKITKEFLRSEGISYTRHGRIYVALEAQIILTSTSKGSNI